MFLNYLDDEAKRAFLYLALICAKSDDVLDEREEKILRVYCDEMGLEMPIKTSKADYFAELYKDDKSKFETEIESIVSKIYYSYPKSSLLIVYFELCAVIYADEVVTEMEDYLLNLLRSKIKISFISYTKKDFKGKMLNILENSAKGILV